MVSKAQHAKVEKGHTFWADSSGVAHDVYQMDLVT